MTLGDWLDSGILASHTPSRGEIAGLLAIQADQASDVDFLVRLEPRRALNPATISWRTKMVLDTPSQLPIMIANSPP